MAKELNFYDVKAKEKFFSKDYKIVTKLVRGSNRKYAVAESPLTGIQAFRSLPKDFKK